MLLFLLSLFLVNLFARSYGELIACNTVGFGHRSSRNALVDMIGSTDYQNSLSDDDGADYFVVSNSNVGSDVAFVSTDHNVENTIVESDIIVVNLPLYVLKMDETRVMSLMQRALSSCVSLYKMDVEGTCVDDKQDEEDLLIIKQDVNKKTLVFVVNGNEDALSETLTNGIKLLAAESWMLLDKPKYLSDRIMNEVDIEIVGRTPTIKGNIHKSSKSTWDKIVNKLKSQSALENVNDLSERLQELNSSPSFLGDKGKNNDKNVEVLQGYEECEAAKFQAILWAQAAAQANTARLQRYEKNDEFRSFMENLMNGAKKVYSVSLKRSLSYKTDGEVEKALLSSSNSVLRRYWQEVQSEIFNMLLPFYRRQVQLIRVECANNFNKAAGDDLAITCDIMNDLKCIMDDVLKDFRIACQRLLPQDAPKLSWNYDIDTQQLRVSMEEYLDNREAGAKLVGVLPRGRKPIDVSIHVFATHPFGKDYRQDALTINNNDKIVYSKEAAYEEDNQELLSPSQYRKILLDMENNIPTEMSRSDRAKLKKKSEFAREMLMFPLSVKNPEVPLAAGRAKKKSSVEAAQVDPERIAFGPERFIKWDNEIMREARNTLDNQVKMNIDVKKDAVNDFKDNIINIIPLFKKGFYKTPPINYGEAYDASKP